MPTPEENENRIIELQQEIIDLRMQIEAPKIDPFTDIPKDGQRMIQELEVGTVKDIVDKTVLGLLTDTQKTDLTDSGATTLHTHDHADLYKLSADDHTQYLEDLVDDTTPQLGGNLDVNSKGIQFPSGTVWNFLDEDAMGSNSISAVATQQSIKAYVDNNIGHLAEDGIYASADTERSNSAHDGLYAKQKDITMYKGGTFRVKFDAKYVGTLTSQCEVRVYKNGTAHGTQWTIETTAFSTTTEDITGWSDADEVQLYSKSVSIPENQDVVVRNFRIYVNDGYTVNTD